MGHYHEKRRQFLAAGVEFFYLDIKFGKLFNQGGGMMKLTFSKEDLENYRETYADQTAAVGYTQKARYSKVILPTYYVLVIDEQQITIIQQNWKIDEIGVTQIQLKDIEQVKISKVLLLHHVRIQTRDKKYKLHVYPLYWGLGAYQTDLVNRLKQLATKYNFLK